MGHGPDGSDAQTLRTAVGQRGHGALDGDRSAAEGLGDRRDGQRPGAGQAHDVGAAYGVGDAQLEHLRLVAETLHPVGVEELQPRLAAAGEPAERGPVGRSSRRLGDREISTVCTTVRRCSAWPFVANVRTSVPLSARVGEAGRLADRVDAAAAGVVGGPDQAPRLARGEQLHLRQGQQHLVGHRLGVGRLGVLPRPAPRHLRVRRTGHRARVSAERVRRPRPRRAATDAAGRLRWIVRRSGQGGRLRDRGERLERGPDAVGLGAGPPAERVGRLGEPLLDPLRTVSPSSRPMSAVDRAARWASSSTLRCWSGRWCSASRTVFCSALMPFSRCQSRATCRRWAIAQARGRTHSSGSGSRLTLRQWCRAATNASSTAFRAGGEVAGQGVGGQHQPASAGEVEVVEIGFGIHRMCGHTGPRLPACLTGLPGFLGQDGEAMTDLLSRPSDTSTSTRPATTRLGRLLGALRGARRAGRTATSPRAGRSPSRPPSRRWRPRRR